MKKIILAGLIMISGLMASNTEKERLFIILTLAASENSKSLPQKVDEATDLIKIEANENPLSLTYISKIHKIDSNPNVSYKLFKETPNIKNITKNMVIKSVCGDEGMKIFFENNILIVYKYIWEDDRPLFDVTVTNKDCE